MEIALTDQPMFIRGQFVDSIGEYTLYYNPLGYGGVTVVDEQSRRLLSRCDGVQTISQILRQDERVASEVIGEVKTLAEREVVVVTEEYTRQLHNQSRGGSSISCWLHLTNRCNLKCDYCYIHKSPGSMTLATGMKAVDRMVQTCHNHGVGKMNIKFAGGEPLLRFELLKKLVDYSQRTSGTINVTYTVLTNGILITPQVAEYLRSHNFGVAVSLDGVGSVNDLCRHDGRGNGSFLKVIKGLDTLVEAGIAPFILTTVSQSNYPHLLELTKFLLERRYHFRFSLERDCVTGWPELMSHKEELIESLHHCYDRIERNLPERDFLELHTFGDVNFRRPASVACGAGRNFLAIGHDGNLGSCGLGLADPFSSLGDEGDLLDLLRGSNPELSRNIASNFPRCNECTWRKSCAGGCPLQAKATYGRFERPSPYCEVYKSILPRILRIKGVQMIRGFEARD